MKRSPFRHRLWVLVGIALLSANVAAQGNRPIDAGKGRVIDLWTPERRAAAIPRDLFVDQRGLGYLRHGSGYLQPYGHATPAQTAQADPGPSPFAKATGNRSGGGGSGDSTPPAISGMSPGEGATIGASQTFSAIVTDPSGVQSVTFRVGKVGSSMQSFSASRGSNDTWSVGLQAFTDGSWTWEVVAKDASGKRGNTGQSGTVSFTVSTASGGGGSSGTVSKAEWTGGKVQAAAGRIYFYMGNTGYVCSGTVATDGVSNRSVIVTAAHCVYDDVNKAFAHDVMFIPNQAASGTRTDRNCSNDVMGCWVPDYGVVDRNWTTRTFPDNIPWDYAFYVVPDSGAHQQGTSTTSDVLDTAAGSLPLSFASPNHDVPGSSDFTHALGYSYSDDPKFMFCAEDMTTTNGSANWWLGSCGLSGGASGGPWLQPMDEAAGSGTIISVNSWGYVDSSGKPLPGMAGPKLSGTSAQCVFGAASSATTTTQLGGVVVICQ
jgi:hypothetical protein